MAYRYERNAVSLCEKRHVAMSETPYRYKGKHTSYLEKLE
jgi:hypothetical protein